MIQVVSSGVVQSGGEPVQYIAVVAALDGDVVVLRAGKACVDGGFISG